MMVNYTTSWMKKHYDQIPLNYEQVEDAIKFLKENEVATIRFYQGQLFQVEAPNFAELDSSRN